MKRRDTAFALLALGVAAFEVHTQAAKPARIVYFGYGTPEAVGHLAEALKLGMRALGYVEGKNVVFEVRWALLKAERLPILAKEILALEPDVIVTPSAATARAMQSATTTTPIVFATISDPIAYGLVQSLARPGGNITGHSSLAGDFSPKLLELLLTLVPKPARLAVLFGTDGGREQLVNLQAAAATIGVTLLVMELQTPTEIAAAFARMTHEQAKGVIGLASGLLFTQRRQIAELAARHRMPSVFLVKEHVDAGGLMSYGTNYAESVRISATYVDRILKGAKPGDLAVEQSSKFEFVISLKTAKALGITIPQSVLLRADEVIQ